MQSGSVNAALLLSSYLGTENEKIGHGIARSDFAGELSKLFPQKATSDTGASGKKGAESSDLKTAMDTAQTTGAQTADTSVAAESKDQSSGSVAAGGKKSSSTAPEERLESLKNRTRSSRNIYITNPVLIESILAELQYPAETIKACKSLQTQDGWISLKDLKGLLAKKIQTDGSNVQGRVSTAQAQALLASIVQRVRDSGGGRGTFSALNESVTSIQQKTTGSYSNEEFRSLLDQVLQRANTAEVRKNVQSASAKTITGSATSISTQNSEIALQSTVTPKLGQSESMTSSILPSFLSDDPDDSGEKKRESGAKSQPAPDSASRGINAGLETLAASKEAPGPAIPVSKPDAVTGPAPELKSDPARTAAAIKEAVREQRNGVVVADTAAQTEENIARVPTSATTAPAPEAGDRAGLNATAQSLASLAEEFGATIVSADADKPAASTAETAPQSDARAAAVQGQNLSTLARETVKGTGDKIAVSELQTRPNLSETAQSPAQITTRQTESSQDQPFPDYDPNRAAALVRNFGDRVQAAGEIETQQIDPAPELGAGMTVQAASAGQKPVTRTTGEEMPGQGREITGIVKELEKQLKFRDSASDTAVLQSAAHHITENRMEVPLAQQASGGNAGYSDPSRMADIIENFREQYRAMGGQNLTLELEPEQLGKISIRVGAKNHEVSAVVVTENESARQAILKNTPDLRQSLDDQGLQLGRFQVDVGRDKAGSGNANPEWQKRESHSADTSSGRMADTDGQVGNRPVYIRRHDGLSQLSIFA